MHTRNSCHDQSFVQLHTILLAVLFCLLPTFGCAGEPVASESGSGSGEVTAEAATGGPVDERAAEPPESFAGSSSGSLGDGFLVWESNRSGSWRLWIRELADSEPRQLVPDEEGRRHCCAHISPDGEWIAYLSLPVGKQEYSDGTTSGVLRLVRPDGTERQVLAPKARTYFEHRAAVWRSPTELIYIGPDGRTLVRELYDGESRELTHEPVPEYGALVDSTLSWATSGRADFSVYQPDPGRVVPRADQSGCQPYFSHDGRWGFWTAGVGGADQPARPRERRGDTHPAQERSDSAGRYGLSLLPDGLS